MDNSEAISGGSCADAGARAVHPEPAGGTEDVTLGVAAATLGWVILTLLWAAEPLSGLAVDPLGSVTATAKHVSFFLGLTTPLIALLALLVYRSWKAGSQLRIPLPGSARTALGPGIVALVAVAWGVVSLLLRSEPGYDLMSGILWLAFTGCLAVAWLSILVPNAYRSWKASGIKKAPAMVSYLLPLPLAAVALFIVIPGRAPLEVRFELSEAALTRYVEQYESTGGESASVTQFVGLYSVGEPYRRDGCLILPTQGGLDYLAGFAYCTGSLPDKPNVDMDHIKGRWWTYEIYH